MSRSHFLVAALLVFSLGLVDVAHAQKKGTVVFFTANWCAGCREVLPIAQDISNQNQLTFRSIDVDDQNAPREAKSLGINIPTGDLPQVLLLGPKGANVIFEGKQFTYGKPDAVRAILLQNLQGSL